MRGVLGLLTATLVFTSCGTLNTTVPDAPSSWPAAKTAEGQRLRNQLEEILPFLPPEQRINVQFYDADTALAYDRVLGEIPLEIGRLDSSGSKFVFPNGGKLNYRNPYRLTAQADCEPYRQVRSTVGFGGVRGNVRVPYLSDVTGLDQLGEAAYNYVGLYTNANVGSGGLVEAGFFTASATSGNFSQDVWYAYETAINNSISGVGYNTSAFVVRRDFAALGYAQGFGPGTNVRVDYRVVTRLDAIGNRKSNTAVTFSIPGTNISKTYLRDFAYAVDPLNLYASRTTSYLSNTHYTGDGSRNNAWTGVTLQRYTRPDPRTAGTYTDTVWNAQVTSAGFPINTEGKAATGNPTCPTDDRLRFNFTETATAGLYDQDTVSIFYQ